MSYNVKIEFSCDYTGDHRLGGIHISNKEFTDFKSALKFFEECKEPITTLSEIYPFKEKKQQQKVFVDFD